MRGDRLVLWLSLLHTHPELPLQVHGDNVDCLKFCKGVIRVYSNTRRFLYYQQITTVLGSGVREVDKINTLLSMVKYVGLSKF